jgi:hypothetical protein
MKAAAAAEGVLGLMESKFPLSLGKAFEFSIQAGKMG